MVPAQDGAPSWAQPPSSLTLADDEVHVWRVQLSQLRAHLRALQGLLSADEQQRAQRVLADERRDGFIAARALLRLLIGGYQGTAPHELRFDYGPAGKPRLREADNRTLTFNLAHSGGLALYAITRGRQVGVDVERVRDDLPLGTIAERYYCANERAQLSALTGTALTRTFFTYWTAKEAVLKARGDGLSGGLAHVDVHALTNVGSIAIDDDAHRSWTVHRLQADDGLGPETDNFRAPDGAAATGLAPATDTGFAHAAALAIEGTGARLRCWSWPSEPADAPFWVP